ncbi:hypothetical protein LRAMOSA00384 [Lichtheimia ramosa]|uniref:Uncharacterized protein n=1 Tax=Lichtheimia ramosa TaxID=688394 RepID=A0A077W6B9_9FUNG|nr:hypothetical protein LRAMOSA00384 [Lichtheimia ramosa]
MESLRTVISRLFADPQDPTATPLEDTNRRYCGYFSRKPSKRRRVSLLHPKTEQAHADQTALDDSPMVAFLLQTSRLDYDTLANDFLRTCVVGNMSEQLKVIMLKYREPPLTLVKTTRLMAFLNHLLTIVPVTPKASTGSTGHGSLTNTPFPLGQLFEDLTLTLSLRPAPGNNKSLTLSIWVVTIQFMLSCLKSNSQQALYNAGIATPAILGIIKHILLELTRLPATNMDPLQQQCFSLGKQMLDLFLVREHPTPSSDQNTASVPIGIGSVSYYDVIVSFPELYGHFINEAPPTTGTQQQPTIANHNVWLMTLQYMITSITQDHRLMDKIHTVMAVNIIKHVLREINTLPANMSTAQIDCLNKGKELINILLLGPMGDGAGVVSHYDIIVALPDVYGHFLRGTFAQSIHWTMEKFINELGKRRRHLAFLMMPPDASWPLISQLSRRHEYNDLTTRTSFHMFEGDLIEFVKEGNSTNIETHFRDMLFQRASMDEFRQLELSLTQTGLDTRQIRKAMVDKVRDVLQCIQQHSRSEQRPNANPPSQDDTMWIPSNLDLWELMNETADQLYSFVTADFFTYEDILQDFYDLVYQPNGEEYPAGAKHHLTKDNGLIWFLLQLFPIEKVAKEVIPRDFEGDESLFAKLGSLYNEAQTRSVDAFTIRDLALQSAITLQQGNIKDVANIKQRHRGISSALQYTSICYKLQAYFRQNYHNNVKNPDLFRNLDISEMTRIALVSQMRGEWVPFTLYVYLVPNEAEVGTLGNPESTYLRGGSLSYQLLDLLSVSAKHRLLQVIYKMMLESDVGPKYQVAQISCVPPNVIDAVYKLLYSAPCSSELMVKEIFDKIRRCDKRYKSKQDGQSTGNNEMMLPLPTMRWLHTILQLMNYRFLRQLKYPFDKFDLLILDLTLCTTLMQSLTTILRSHQTLQGFFTTFATLSPIWNIDKYIGYSNLLSSMLQ